MFVNINIYFVNNIGIKIRKKREGQGIKQEFMAYHLNITQSNYGRLEKDDNRLTVPKLKKISEILDVPIADFFDTTDSNLNKPSDELSKEPYLHHYIESLKEEITFLRKLLENIKRTV